MGGRIGVMATWRLWAFRIGVMTGVVLFFGGLLLMRDFPEAGFLPGLGWVLVIAGVVLGVRRATCPQCGRRIIMAGVNLAHCTACGSPMERWPDPIP